MFLKNDNVSSELTIGRKTAILRHTLGYTQADFADAIMMARGSLVKLEKAESNTQVGIDILLRLFYAMVRLSTNTNDKYIKTLSEDIINDIIRVIENSVADQSDYLCLNHE